MILSLCVVVKNVTELSWITSHHEKRLQMSRKRRGVYILQGGIEVYYMTQYQFDTWKLGRTYMHLIDYLMGNDLFFHSGIMISREQMRKLFESKEG